MNTLTYLTRSIRRKHPALLMSLSILLGTAFALDPHIIYLIALIILCLPYVQHTLIPLLLAFGLTALSVHYRIPHLSFPEEKFPIRATFIPTHLKLYETPFQKSYVYLGSLHHAQGATGYTLPDLPCRLFFPLKGSRPSAAYTYCVQGTLEQKSPYLFILKPTHYEALHPTFSLAEWRFVKKRELSCYLEQKIGHPKVAHFLHALATGEIDERTLSMELGKVGLQHLLAVSGFHFNLLAGFLSLFLFLFIPRKAAYLLLLGFLTLYFLFLGNCPSVERAYTMFALILMGRLLGLKISGLNALGLSLGIALVKDPLVVLHMGFQLSFLCTLAILLVYPLCRKGLSCLFRTRTLSQTLKMSSTNQWGYILLFFFKEAIALNIAVHLLSLLPLLLLFHKFPWISLSYNLFFPGMISLSLFLLYASLLFSPLPYLSDLLHLCNRTWTQWALNMSCYPPAAFDFVLRTPHVTLPMVILFLTLAFHLFSLLSESIDQKHAGA